LLASLLSIFALKKGRKPSFKIKEDEEMNDDIAKEWFQTLLEPLNLELYMQENIAS